MKLTLRDGALLQGTILTTLFCSSELRKSGGKKQYIGLTVVVTLRQIQSNDGFSPPTKDDVGLTCGQEKAPVWTELKQQRQHIYCLASLAQLCLREGAATPLIYCAAFHSKTTHASVLNGVMRCERCCAETTCCKRNESPSGGQTCLWGRGK